MKNAADGAALPVSVIVPVYNHEKYVEQCLRSIASGERQPAEIILVDNGSTDRSVAVAEGLGFRNLKVIRNGSNLGASRARTIGVRAAQHDLICFVDSDDYLGEGAVGSAYAAVIEGALDYAIFELRRVNQDGSNARLETAAPAQPIEGVRAFELTLGGWQIFSMGVLEKRLYLDAVDEFVYHGYADDELLVREVYLRARRIGGSRGVYYYRDVPKPYTFERVLGQVTANVAVLRMAYERRALLSSDGPLRRMRNLVARNLVGLQVRAWRARIDHPQVRQLQSLYRSMAIGWRASDLRSLAFHMALRCATIRNRSSAG